MASMKGHRRQQVMSPRSKKIGISSLWLAYSEKLKADVHLAGDYEMLHWVSELETNPTVRSFKHDENVNVSLLVDDESKFESLRVIYVECTDGTVELHQIDASDNMVLERVCTPVRFFRLGEREIEARLVHISAARLKDFSKSSLAFWLRVLGFVSQIRDYDMRHEMGLAGTAVALNKAGTIRSLLENLAIADPAIAVGAICRMILHGKISVVVERRGFGYNTQWSLP
jgi:hypothetical protein